MTTTPTPAAGGIDREIGADGSFVRQPNRFVTPFGDGPGELPVQTGRYRLLVARVCPWAHRQLIVLELLGLTDAISVGVASSRRGPDGWEFSLDPDGVDPVLGIRTVTDAYRAADPGYTLRPTVPAVVDLTTGAVVNNDYPRLTTAFEVAWAPLHAAGAPDLYPVALREQIDALNVVLFEEVNNAVYRAGFARTHTAYERAYDTLFARLDDLERRLADRRYLFGDAITDSDVRLWVTLVRFDAAYYLQFKANRNRLVDFPNLWGYARDLYQTPGFGSTTDLDAIKVGYQAGQHPYGLVSKGPDASAWTTPHGRG